MDSFHSEFPIWRLGALGGAITVLAIGLQFSGHAKASATEQSIVSNAITG